MACLRSAQRGAWITKSAYIPAMLKCAIKLRFGPAQEVAEVDPFISKHRLRNVRANKLESGRQGRCELLASLVLLLPSLYHFSVVLSLRASLVLQSNSRFLLTSNHFREQPVSNVKAAYSACSPSCSGQQTIPREIYLNEMRQEHISVVPGVRKNRQQFLLKVLLRCFAFKF